MIIVCFLPSWYSIVQTLKIDKNLRKKIENQIQKINKEYNPLLFYMKSKLDFLVKGQKNNSNKSKVIKKIYNRKQKLVMSTILDFRLLFGILNVDSFNSKPFQIVGSFKTEISRILYKGKWLPKKSKFGLEVRAKAKRNKFIKNEVRN